MWKLVSSYFSFGEWMRSSSSAKADQQRVHAEAALQQADDRDRAAAADEGGLAVPFLGQRPARRLEGRVIERHDGGAPAAARLEARPAVGRQAVADEGPEELADALGVLVADQPEADLGVRLGRDHRLEAGAGIAAPDAVDLGGRARPEVLEGRVAVLAPGLAQADLAEEGLAEKPSRSHCSLIVGRELVDAVVEAGDGDARRRRHAWRPGCASARGSGSAPRRRTCRNAGRARGRAP